jgi:hypothetical protein
MVDRISKPPIGEVMKDYWVYCRDGDMRVNAKSPRAAAIQVIQDGGVRLFHQTDVWPVGHPKERVSFDTDELIASIPRKMTCMAAVPIGRKRSMVKVKKKKLPASFLSTVKGALEFVYPFVALDQHYGLFYHCYAHRKAIPHKKLREHLAEAKALIDLEGNDGLYLWHERMTKRGFRLLPSTLTAYRGQAKPPRNSMALPDVEDIELDCIPRS